MSERISIVVPDGTRDRLKKEAERQNRSQSNLSRKYILDGLNGNYLKATVTSEDVEFVLNRKGKK